MIRLFALPLLSFALLGQAPAPTPPSATHRPTTDVPLADCTSAGCHANLKNYPVIHGPVAVNACDACHKLTSAADHTFDLQRPKSDLCLLCHDVDTASAAVVHQPLRDGNCLPCHTPHGGATKALLAGDTSAGPSQLCKQCHQDVTAGKQFVHGPVAADACGACHQPHASAFPNLLSAAGKELCLTCHASTRTQLQSARFVHGPANVDCAACHDAHASNQPMMVKAPPAELCLSCHEQVRDVINQSPVKHAAVTQDRACLSCHQPHASNLAGIIKAESADLCLSCHDKPLSLPNGSTLASVKEVLDPSKILHGPVAQKNCSGCHVVHGGDHFRLLTRDYPAAFYAPFNMDNYALCFSCHDAQLLRDPRTTTLTAFRNGDLNLHFLHVNKQKGRTCRACHATHASDNDKHVRDSVPYGKGGWMLPINYQAQPDGGSCAPGCHTPYAYDRASPVTYPTDSAATQPTATTTPTAPVSSQGVQP